MPTDDLYNRLGVERTATPAEIKRAYRRASKHAHPDAEGGSPEKWGALAEAYEVLGDDRRRRVYDETGRIDATEPDNRHAALIVRIAMAMVQIAGAAGAKPYTSIDWVSSIRATLKAEIAQIRQGIPEMERQARQWEACVGRAHAADGKENVIAALAAGNARSCRLRIDQAGHEIGEREEALKLIEGATFLADTLPQAAAMGQYGFGLPPWAAARPTGGMW